MSLRSRGLGPEKLSLKGWKETSVRITSSDPRKKERTLRRFGQQWQKLQRSGKRTEMYLLVFDDMSENSFCVFVGVETKI